jgi:pimeloyl-ACP methyl ester carboxylesterase
VATIGKVGAEFEALTRHSATLGDYRGILTPTRLIVGDRTQRSARAVVEELLLLLPDATIRVIEGAGHMSLITHTESVNQLVAGHIDAVMEAARQKSGSEFGGTWFYPYSVTRTGRRS